MINTIIVEDNIYMQNHLSSMLSGDERFNLIASLRDAFEAEKVCQTEMLIWYLWMCRHCIIIPDSLPENASVKADIIRRLLL